MAILEHEQWRRKVLMDRHRGTNEKYIKIGKAVVVFQTRIGQRPGKLHFRWTGLYWILGVKNETFKLGTLAGEVLR